MASNGKNAEAKRMMRLGRLGATGVGLLGLLIPVAGIAAGQGARPVPKLDMQQYVGTWFVIEQYPVKEQKGCLSDIRMLYTRGEGPRAFLTVTSCSIKGNNWDVWNEGGNATRAAMES
jgi:lipocalin